MPPVRSWDTQKSRASSLLRDDAADYSVEPSEVDELFQDIYDTVKEELPVTAAEVIGAVPGTPSDEQIISYKAAEGNNAETLEWIDRPSGGGGGGSGDITGVSVTAPLTGGGTTGDVTVGIQAASTSQDGYLSKEDKSKIDTALQVSDFQPSDSAVWSTYINDFQSWANSTGPAVQFFTGEPSDTTKIAFPDLTAKTITGVTRVRIRKTVRSDSEYFGTATEQMTQPLSGAIFKMHRYDANTPVATFTLSADAVTGGSGNSAYWTCTGVMTGDAWSPGGGAYIAIDNAEPTQFRVPEESIEVNNALLARLERLSDWVDFGTEDQTALDILKAFVDDLLEDDDELDRTAVANTTATHGQILISSGNTETFGTDEFIYLDFHKADGTDETAKVKKAAPRKYCFGSFSNGAWIIGRIRGFDLPPNDPYGGRIWITRVAHYKLNQWDENALGAAKFYIGRSFLNDGLDEIFAKVDASNLTLEGISFIRGTWEPYTTTTDQTRRAYVAVDSDNEYGFNVVPVLNGAAQNMNWRLDSANYTAVKNHWSKSKRIEFDNFTLVIDSQLAELGNRTLQANVRLVSGTLDAIGTADKPTIRTVPTYDELADVAFSGRYDDLVDDSGQPAAVTNDGLVSVIHGTPTQGQIIDWDTTNGLQFIDQPPDEGLTLSVTGDQLGIFNTRETTTHTRSVRQNAEVNVNLDTEWNISRADFSGVMYTAIRIGGGNYTTDFPVGSGLSVRVDTGTVHSGIVASVNYGTQGGRNYTQAAITGNPFNLANNTSLTTGTNLTVTDTHVPSQLTSGTILLESPTQFSYSTTDNESDTIGNIRLGLVLIYTNDSIESEDNPTAHDGELINVTATADTGSGNFVGKTVTYTHVAGPRHFITGFDDEIALYEVTGIDATHSGAIELKDGQAALVPTSELVLDGASLTRTSADRGKLLAVSSTDENAMALVTANFLELE